MAIRVCFRLVATTAVWYSDNNPEVGVEKCFGHFFVFVEIDETVGVLFAPCAVERFNVFGRDDVGVRHSLNVAERGIQCHGIIRWRRGYIITALEIFRDHDCNLGLNPEFEIQADEDRRPLELNINDLLDEDEKRLHWLS